MRPTRGIMRLWPRIEDPARSVVEKLAIQIKTPHESSLLVDIMLSHPDTDTCAYCDTSRFGRDSIAVGKGKALQQPIVTYVDQDAARYVIDISHIKYGTFR